MATNTGHASVKTATRKKLQFRDTRLGVIPNTVDAFSRLTLDAAMKAALTAAGAKLTVEIDTAGTRVFLADQRTGQLIGGPEDLQRLGGIRSFVSRERKDAQGVEIAKEVTQLAFKANVTVASMIQGYVQVPLDASYGAAVRPLLTVVRHIDDNKKKLGENNNPRLREPFEKFLETQFSKVRNVYFRLILLHTQGENTKGKLQELLFEYGVPEYVHSRLTNPNLVLDRAQDLCRVLFPSDPSKGLTLTLKEWRSVEFRNKLGLEMLAFSGLAMKLSNDDNFLRTITKIDASVSLSDETNPSVAKLLKCRLAVMPPMGTHLFVTEPGGKSKAGWKFPSPSMDTQVGAINALSTALLRVYSANLQSVDLVGDYYATIAPGAVKRAAVTPTNNFYVQWANADDPDSRWLNHITGGDSGSSRANVWRWLRTEMRLSEKAEGGKSLACSLLLNEDGSPLPDEEREIEVEKPDPKNPDQVVKVKEKVTFYPSLDAPATRARAMSLPRHLAAIDLLRPLSAVEVPHWERFQRDTFPSKKKGKEKREALSQTLTALTPQGKALVEELEGLSPFIASRMRTWLRGFSDERVQRAAVKLANASFDELFIAESKDSDNESDSDESDNDD